jgi:hypothetical protein
MNELLCQDLPDECNWTAYADDIAITIPGNSRKELEEKAQTCSQILEKWSSKVKLRISTKKTVYVVYGKALSRNPTVKIYNIKRILSISGSK